MRSLQVPSRRPNHLRDIACHRYDVVMASIQNETVIALEAVGKHLPHKISKRTAWRWAFSGLAGVQLESMVVGRRRYTSTEAIDRFIENVSRARAPRNTT
jgi:uncharacterized protein DUF1580